MYCLKQAVRDIGLYMNLNKKRVRVFQTKIDITTQSGMFKKRNKTKNKKQKKKQPSPLWTTSLFY